MTWRGSTTVQDKLLGCLVYLLPILDSLPYGLNFLKEFLGLNVLAILQFPLVQLYRLPFIPFVVFFALYVLVVRNEDIGHFIRFNAMQAIMMSIVLSLFGIIWQYILGPVLGNSLLTVTLFNTVFLGTITAVTYSVVQSALGRYAEIPTISDAAHAQVR
mgnify:CR=1 FL=1